jgi:hypothetical protein
MLLFRATPPVAQEKGLLSRNLCSRARGWPVPPPPFLLYHNQRAARAALQLRRFEALVADSRKLRSLEKKCDKALFGADEYIK